MSAPHGFGDDERSRFLRRRPPAEALAWVERSLGVRVVGHRAMRGGSSSSLHTLRIVGAGGATESVVLRRYVLANVVDEQPDIAEREADVLQLLDRTTKTPTPRLLAADPSGDASGVPALVMTRLPGRVDWSPRELQPWLAGLAAVLPDWHGIPDRDLVGVRPFRPYDPETWSAPPWMRHPALWDRALDVFHGPVLDPERVFIHRDFHPGNVLWRRGRVTGVVDWQAAAVGPPSVDAFWCRVNLIDNGFGLDVADRYLDLWQHVSGRTYHPWAEVVMLLDVIAWREERSLQERDDLEHTLARRLAELG